MIKDTLLNQGIAFLEVGDRDRAQHLFAQAVEQDPQNALAWLWLSKVVISTDERRSCLENALLLDPKILVRQQENIEGQSAMDMARSFPQFQTIGASYAHASTNEQAFPEEPSETTTSHSQTNYDQAFSQSSGEIYTFADAPEGTTEYNSKALQAIGEIYKMLGLTLGALTLVAAIGLFVLSMMNNTTIIVNSSSNLGLEVFDGLLGSLLVIIAGGSVAATLYAAGEGIYLLLTMEKNSRTATTLLQELYKLIKEDQKHNVASDDSK